MLHRGRLHLVALLLLVSACAPRAAWEDSDRDSAPISGLYDARDLLRAGRFSASLEAAQALVAAHPTSWQARRVLQDAHRSLWEPPRFVAHYVDGAEAGSALGQYLAGRALIRDSAAAHAAFSRTVELDPTSTRL